MWDILDNLKLFQSFLGNRVLEDGPDVKKKARSVDDDQLLDQLRVQETAYFWALDYVRSVRETKKVVSEVRKYIVTNRSTDKEEKDEQARTYFREHVPKA